MSIVTCDISVSMDGYSAGVDQSLEQPLGDIDETWLHAWMFDGADENQAEVDAIVDAGAFIMHRDRDPGPREGGTTVHVVTEGIHAALEQARAAAGERNVAVAGGASTVNQFLAAGLIDELRVHVTPVILGAGERLFEGVPRQRLEQVSARGTSLVTHLVYRPVR